MLIALQYRLWNGYANYRQISNLETMIATQEKTIAQLYERNNQVLYDVLDLKNGQDALEEYAREEVGMIKKDEIFYQVIRVNAQ